MIEKQDAYKKRGVDYRVSVSMLTLPREYYQSETLYREEVEKIFCKRCEHAGHAGRHATPIHGLYLCGSGSHPGGGLTGVPGMLAAVAILSSS